MPSETRMKKNSARGRRAYPLPVTILFIAATILALSYLFMASGSVLLRFFLAIVVLIISGSAIARANGIPDSYGAYLHGGKKGIDLVDSLASRNEWLWNGLADWGLGLGFGLLSLPMFGKRISKKTFLLGMATILVILIFVFPYLSLVLSFINLPQITNAAAASTTTTTTVQGSNLLYYALIAAGIIGGFSLFTMIVILYAGGSILLGIFEFIAGYASSNPNYSLLTSQVPGVAPIIPGITIPFSAGIISLVALLIVHEFSHGIQARIAKIKIKSIGVILFGIIPLGAYVEPDESKVKKLKARDQDRISIAGISANMFVSLLFFAVTLLMLYLVLPNVSTGGVIVTSVMKNSPAYGIIAPNSTVLMWNNLTIRNEYDLATAESGYIAGNYVSITTNGGVSSIMPSGAGKLGIYVAPAATSSAAYQVTNFIYAIAVLSFGLNFFVAIFNLLPIPGFDGWRIYQGKVKNKRLLKALAALIVAAILINVLPWFWTL
jgi:Peptidase family M50